MDKTLNPIYPSWTGDDDPNVRFLEEHILRTSIPSGCNVQNTTDTHAPPPPPPPKLGIVHILEKSNKEIHVPEYKQGICGATQKPTSLIQDSYISPCMVAT
eukprot:GHVP01011384.1.p1 GENE.GHVP01011384.1~~GHVP01011384.1.p1  ORF type:complete len:101 (+),score=7.86 GHVP01011384.1:27-329(+)